MKILVIGGTGFLGASLLKNLATETINVEVVYRNLIDLGKPLSRSARKFIAIGQYDYMIICAAITDIERCFQEQDASYQVNVQGTRELLSLIKQCATIPVFFSTDYVFGGEKTSYKEDDPRLPKTVYGQQKLEIEQYLESNFQNYLIFRTSKLMSKCVHPKNILYPIIQNLAANREVRCFEDQWLNPVFIEDIAEVLKRALNTPLRGVFHLGTKKIFSRAELGRFLATTLGYDPYLIKSILMADMNVSEQRPTHNVLNCDFINDIIDFRFQEIEDVVIELRKNLEATTNA